MTITTTSTVLSWQNFCGGSTFKGEGEGKKVDSSRLEMLL